MADTPQHDRWFLEQVHAHLGALTGWLSRRYPDLTDPENVAQEAVTRIWGIYRHGPIASPKALLFTTAQHLALDQLRRGKIVTWEQLPATYPEPWEDEQPDPAATTAHKQELELLTQAIQSLPERCRRVLTLRKIYGLSQKQIAAELGISEHTVEVQVANGMRRCAAFFEKLGLL